MENLILSIDSKYRYEGLAKSGQHALNQFRLEFKFPGVEDCSVALNHRWIGLVRMIGL